MTPALTGTSALPVSHLVYFHIDISNCLTGFPLAGAYMQSEEMEALRSMAIALRQILASERDSHRLVTDKNLCWAELIGPEQSITHSRPSSHTVRAHRHLREDRRASTPCLVVPPPEPALKCHDNTKLDDDEESEGEGADDEEETEDDGTVSPQHGHTACPVEGDSDEDDILLSQPLTKRSKRGDELILTQRDILDPI